MKLSLSNGIFCKRPLAENIAEVKRLGFENLEFNMKSIEVESDVSVYKAKKLISDCGLRCLTVHAATLHVKDPIEVYRAVYYGKISLECAHKLSAPIMTVHSNIARKLPETTRQGVLKEVFGELMPFAKRLGITLAIENLSYASTGYGKNVIELDEIFQTIDKNNTMGFTLDFCHAEATGQTVALLEKYHKRLCNIHLANRAHKPFESPTSRLVDLLQMLRNYNYDGPLSLELSKKCPIEAVTKTKNVVETLLKD